MSSRKETEGRALSKTVAFRCFQIHHAVSMISDEVPFLNWRGVVRNTNDHHSMKSPSTIGGLAVDRIQDNTSCQTVLEKGQPVRMCAIVSSEWSHNGQLAGCGRPRRARRAPVQHLSCHASQMKNFTLGGFRDFQLSFHDPETIDPSKRML